MKELTALTHPVSDERAVEANVVIRSDTVRDIDAVIYQLTDGAERCRRTLAEHLGIRSIEFNALRHLYRSGALQPRTLSDRLRLSPGATTALIDRLQAAGFVDRDQHPVDRRSVVISLTPEGIDGIESAYDAAQGALRDRLEQLSLNGHLDSATLSQFIELASGLGDALSAVGRDQKAYPPLQRQVG